MRFIFACAGTAGHINPAISVAETLRKMMPDAQFLFIGSGREMENELIPMAGFEIRNISSTGLVRGYGPKDIAENIVSVKNIFAGSLQAGRIIRKFRPDAVIGTGGYVCYPVLKVAHRMGIPTLIHESNAIPGLATEVLSGVVDRVMVAFPGMEGKYKKPERVVFTGTPIRREFSGADREKVKAQLGLDGKPLVVSFWGSLGARTMNELMAGFIVKNERHGTFNHIHATGGGETEQKHLLSRLMNAGINPATLRNTDVRSYIYDMPLVMTAADLILCRAGASTLGELTATKKPSVLVPSPNATNNHQEKNARRMQEAGCSVMLLERDATGELLYDTTVGILTDAARLDAMAESAGKLCVPDAAERIIDNILSLCN